MTDDPDRSHDTDPLADTQTSEDSPSASSSSSGASEKKRAVHVDDVLGRYELVEDIGEGGMATVFRAKDRELRREVAVKVLFPHLARRDEVVRRFHREARAAAGLEHPNILRVYDVGGAEGNDPPYIVMELIRGRSLLGELEQRGPMLAEVVACIGALLAEALAVAHKAGIIHRDVKPANVMIDPAGRVLLTDFGVARLETEDSLVTKTGALLGTPAYMSPEQAGGDTATAKSDIYSLGATLYQLATGVLPYSGSPAKVMAQIAQGSLVSAVRRRATVGPDLSRIIDRMMASEPTARPGSAAEVASELRKIAAAAGFGEPADELKAYFSEPDAFVKQKLPAVVSALITTAERAIADNKLPRAMALADRASALAPDDPAVTQLVTRVTEGDKATRRNKVLAIIGAGVVLVGGATFGVMQLRGAASHAVVIRDAAIDARPIDAGQVDSSPADAQVILVDAGVPIDAPRGVHVVVRPDARTAVDAAIDAAVAAPPPIDAAAPIEPALGSLVVKNDTWCNLTIDGADRGRRSNKPIKIAAGHHVVVCDQNGINTWKKEVDVEPNKTATVEGFMLQLIEVKLDVDAQIDGVPYKKGSIAKVKGRLAVSAGGEKTFMTFSRPCTLKTEPDLGCY